MNMYEGLVSHPLLVALSLQETLVALLLQPGQLLLHLLQLFVAAHTQFLTLSAQLLLSLLLLNLQLHTQLLLLTHTHTHTHQIS